MQTESNQTSSAGVLQQLRVDAVGAKVDVADRAPADEERLDRRLQERWLVNDRTKQILFGIDGLGEDTCPH